MEMAVKTLPRSLGLSPNHNNNISSATPKPVFHVSLPLRSPNKPPENHHEPPQITAPPAKKTKNPNPHSNAKCSVSDVLRLMDALSLRAPHDVCASLAEECAATADPRGARDLHRHVTQDLRTAPLPLLNRLLLMHVSLDRPLAARRLLDDMPSKDFKSWAVVIVAYVNRSQYREALDLFQEMLENVSMTEFPCWVMACLLKTCTENDGNVELGKQVHGCSVKLGHAESSFLASCLISFYGKFGCLRSADLVFDKLPRRGPRVWMARLVNHSRERLFFEAVRDFKEIGDEGIAKNAPMFSCVLKGCGRLSDGGVYGRQVHGNAVKLGLEWDPYVQCGLVDMYGRSGSVEDAERAFGTRRGAGTRRNNACWNAMLGGYIRNELLVEAVKFVYEMKASGARVQKSLLDDLRIACGSSDSVPRNVFREL